MKTKSASFGLPTIPASLGPVMKELCLLPSGRTVELQQVSPVFEPWRGAPVASTYGNKSVLSVAGDPNFAELAILYAFTQEGWEGVWVDSYRQRYLEQYFAEPKVVQLLDSREELLHKIRAATKRKPSNFPTGCWDVYCWKGEKVMFGESKRRNKDNVKDTQKQWLDAALDIGIPLASFLVAEWTLSI
jgi:hypothetical protein